MHLRQPGTDHPIRLILCHGAVNADGMYNEDCDVLCLTQIMEDEAFPEQLAALHNFLLAALLAPAHLGVTPSEAHSARRLATKAKVCLHLQPSMWLSRCHLCQGIG